jgi:hypothetical protein
MTSRSTGSAILGQIVPGLTGTAEIVVGPKHTAPFVGSGRIAVLATPVMINIIDAALAAVGSHQRVVVSVSRFDERVRRKLLKEKVTGRFASRRKQKFRQRPAVVPNLRRETGRRSSR